MNLDDMVQKPGSWLVGVGPENEVVVSSRVRLARNLKGYNFTTRLSNDGKGALLKEVRRVIDENRVIEGGMFLALDELGPVDRRFLMERHLISREHQEGEGPRGVALRPDEMVSIMVNEEDHLRIQVMLAGLQPLDGWRIADKIDDALEAKIDFAFSQELGYLTACPTNLGTGLRASIMLHLPALHITRKIEQIFSAVSKLNLAVRGLHGEGSEAQGHFYQISNQTTLGKTEERIVQDVCDVIPEIVKWEVKARDALLKRDRKQVEDRIFRACGILKNSRIINSEEAMAMLSFIRMGVQMRVLETVPLAVISELFVFTQPAHLQKRAGKELSPEERDIVRAEFIRERLGPLLN
jgi:protein arginine kinase